MGNPCRINLHVGISQRVDLGAHSAVGCRQHNIDDQIIVIARPPTYFHATLRIGQLAVGTGSSPRQLEP